MSTQEASLEIPARAEGLPEPPLLEQIRAGAERIEATVETLMNTIHAHPTMAESIHEAALGILGPNAEVGDNPWMKGYQFALSGPIYAGTNEIQRNVIAERVLGLPRR